MPLVAASATAANAILRLFNDLPTEIDFTRPSEQSVILAADGSEVAKFYAENRIIVSSENISPLIKKAAVAIEDRRFFEHTGLDAQGIIGAAVNNLTGGRLAGGSTITQQYVKNALIEEGRIAGDAEKVQKATEQTLIRKLNEARYAIAIEKKMDKDQILTAYLNIAQFGPSQWGVEAASRYFFSVSAKDVTLPQAAMLAGITQAPNKWNPLINPRDAQERRDVVLTEMADLEFITPEERDAAIAVPIEDTLKVNPIQNGCESAGISAYFCETVVADVLNSELYGKSRSDRIQMLYRGGLKITSTLDPTAQQAAYDAVVAGVPIDDPSGLETSLSAIEPGTGKILAMAQNTHYGKATEQNPAATTLNLNVGRTRGGGEGFQSGSTFKIFTLVDWIKSGHSIYESVNTTKRLYPANKWNISCAPSLAGPYSPNNNEGEGGGMRSVQQSTALSLNVGYVDMATKLDLCDITATATALGVQRGGLATEADVKQFADMGKGAAKNPLHATRGEPLPLIPNPSMVLGTNPVTPLSMASAAATLAADGKACTPISFTEIKDSSGKVLATQEPSCKEVIKPEVAQQATQALRSVVTSGIGVNASLGARPVAGKTGTTDSANHAWFVGYTPQLATAVWTGNMSGDTPMIDITVNGRYYPVLYGSAIPAHTFRAFNQAALAGKPIKYFTQSYVPRAGTFRDDLNSDSDSDSNQNAPAPNPQPPAANQAPRTEQ